MVKYLIVKKNGDLEQKQTRDLLNIDNVFKLCGYKSKNNFDLIHSFPSLSKEDDSEYKIYGKIEGRANSENKYELPPPIDMLLLFGTLCIIKQTSSSIEDLTKNEWCQLYDSLFGGFEEIDNSDEERSLDSEVFSDSEYTEQGYHKDSFVIEEQELTQEDYL